mmetsp:Transcript_17699/g.44022  ORF Transcript_17699/g.44022 Transcript_17699/m.44022 type:complete len:244 (+) Transcript_17699:250-981(+)
MRVSQRALGVVLRRAERAQRVARRLSPPAVWSVRGSRECARSSVLLCQLAQPRIILNEILQGVAGVYAGVGIRAGARQADERDQRRQRTFAHDARAGGRIHGEPSNRVRCVRLTLLGASVQQRHEQRQCACPHDERVGGIICLGMLRESGCGARLVCAVWSPQALDQCLDVGCHRARDRGWFTVSTPLFIHLARGLFYGYLNLITRCRVPVWGYTYGAVPICISAGLESLPDHLLPRLFRMCC